ncbi:MAG: NAD(P)-dependent oxidoreductase [Candidatus Bathyarchaeota archaeon]|nr:NAD(P)-dependent oxidoreductase [Candidatus Bathyarchaeota archaeon]
MKKHKIGIIGGSGFIGSALAEYLKKSFRVKVLDKKYPPKNLEGKVEFEECDIRRYNEVKQVLNDVDLVIHAAIVQIPLINEEKKLGYEVNVKGTQNVCEVVESNPSIKGLLVAGSWHVFGERGLTGLIDEKFGFQPDKVEDRARLYALCKIAQETIVRLYDEMSEKTYGIIRMGTVLGEVMPEKTAANIFISRGLRGESITPYKNSMHRPMLYVDLNDVCKAYGSYAKKILNCEIGNAGSSLAHIVNLCWPEPVTVLELATLVKDLIVKYSKGRLKPKIEIIDAGKPSPFKVEDKKLMKVDAAKMSKFLGLNDLTSPKESVERIIRARLAKCQVDHIIKGSTRTCAES